MQGAVITTATNLGKKKSHQFNTRHDHADYGLDVVTFLCTFVDHPSRSLATVIDTNTAANTTFAYSIGSLREQAQTMKWNGVTAVIPPSKFFGGVNQYISW
ncbi:uncharacterized protein PV09_01772 [Verruconis gallopava]|uniref:Uncharacterized protein n=1 Tax=Verruconis gallopava TaxID=253628 RepID=A0A0D1Z4G6_9PEZI|nr:uncharacterized protein PV09_01772 [Verruconis gallopava]KIW07857.1 hypothetical protein PV09_01772 [Verruconis gallopava]